MAWDSELGGTGLNRELGNTDHSQSPFGRRDVPADQVRPTLEAARVSHHGSDFRTKISSGLTPDAAATKPHGQELQAITRTVNVNHSQGLHLRPCSAIVATVERHQAKVNVISGGQTVNAASIFGLLSLAAANGTELILSATGAEAEEALEAIANLLNGRTEISA